MSNENYFDRKTPDWQFVYETFTRNYWASVNRYMRFMNPFLLADEIRSLSAITKSPEQGGEGPREDD
jgi:hypothetical protein